MADTERKVAAITGASKGIGKALALKLADMGYNVGIAARNESALEAVKIEIEEKGAKCFFHKTDVTSVEQVQAFINGTIEALGPIDVCVCNAGVMHWDEVVNAKFDSWNQMIDVNCKGVTNVTGAVLPGMVKRKTGFLIYLSSDAGKAHFDGLTVYCATKYFVEIFAKGVRKESAKDGIRVLLIQPGDVATDLGMDTPSEQMNDKYGGYLKDKNVKILQTEHICGAMEFALNQPPYVAVNDILIEPQSFPVS